MEAEPEAVEEVAEPEAAVEEAVEAETETVEEAAEPEADVQEAEQVEPEEVAEAKEESPPEEAELTESELKKMTKAELVAICQEGGLEFDEKQTKAEIIKVIIEESG